MAFAIGDTIGPYRIVSQIGQGGMATVFKAYHANLDRYVAFKVLHPAFKEDPNFLERFKREAQIVARLEHPSIVPVYDFADVNGQPYLVMRFIEGETLKARLKRQPLTLAETLRILEDVADALTYAHNHGILHRDIKPSNIMLDTQGTPFIADFGLARIAQAGESTLSQDMMLGTPQYISPEQAQGVRDLGPATDIYSLGVVLYEIVVGRVPFSADTPFAIVHDHIYKSLPMPSVVNPDVPPEVERVLLKALAKNPQDRYASAVEMVAAFREAIAAAGLTELSAARYRPSVPVSSSTVTVPPDAVSPTGQPAYPVISVPAVGGSTASRQAYRRRANLWILAGVGALLLICLTSLFVIVDAISDPDLRPWDAADEAGAEGDTPPDITAPSDFTWMSLTVDEAQLLVEEHPEDAVSYLGLALAQAYAGSKDEAFASAVYAIDELDAPAPMLASAARRAAEGQHDDLAGWLYLEALSQPDVTPQVRNESGAYLVGRIGSEPGLMVLTINEYLQRRPPSALVYTYHALALLKTGRALTVRQAGESLEAAFALDETLAEAYMVRGLYNQAIDDIEQAQADWQQAASYADAPDWVMDGVNEHLESEQPLSG